MAKNPVVFIHGLWMHSSTWKPWMQFFSEHGYETFNPDWPGDGDTVEASRAKKGDCQSWSDRSSRTVITEFKSFENRGHSLTIDHGWREIAEYLLQWLNGKGL